MSITLDQLPEIITRAVRTGTNQHIVGEPGMGKTEVIEQVAAKLRARDPDFVFAYLYTPSMSPVDFVAYMPNMQDGTLHPFRNKQLPNAYDNPDMKGIVFLGERDNADPATNKALQKYINNEDMGGLRKPAGIIVISDSNALDHRAGAVQQSLALLSRSVVLHVRVDPEVTLRYFSEQGVNAYVQAYLNLCKEHVSDFDKVIETRQYRVWANPRAWFRLGKQMDDAELHGERLSDDEIIGGVGEPVGKQLIAFLYAARELVSYDEIVKSPKKATKPEKLSDQYAIIAMLSQSVQPDDFEAVRTYVERYGVEIQVLFLRLLMNSKGKHVVSCTKTKAYTTWFAKPEMRQAVLGTAA